MYTSMTIGSPAFRGCAAVTTSVLILGSVAGEIRLSPRLNANQKGRKDDDRALAHLHSF